MEDGYGLVEAVDQIQCLDALAPDQEEAEGHLEFVRLHQDLDVSLILKKSSGWISIRYWWTT